MKKFFTFLLAAAMIFSASACFQSQPQEPTGDSPAAATTAKATAETPATPDTGNYVNVCLASEPETIDPALNSAVDGADMILTAFEGLYKWVDSGESVNNSDINYAATEPGQAKSFEKTDNDDGTVTYVFEMRDDILWSDGKPVTAGDFEYAWKRLIDPDTASPYNYIIDMVVNANEIMEKTKTPDELGITAVDDKTLKIDLTYDCPYFLEIAAFASTVPVRKDIIEKNGDQWTFDPATYVTNGPLTMKEWVHNSYITFVPNDNYYDRSAVKSEGVKFVLMDDHNAMFSAFKNGELDFTQEVPLDETKALLDAGDLIIDPYVGTYYISYQNEKAPFDDPRVRKAFTLAVDRDYIVETVTQRGEIPAAGFVPYGIADAKGADGDDFRTVGGDYYDVKGGDEAYQKNCEEARKLLADAGFPGGEGFPTVEYLYNTSDAHKAIAEALQFMWQQELGVTITIDNQDWSVFLATRREGNYMVARNGWIADYNDPITMLDMWVTGGGNNNCFYSNEEYDALIAKAKATSVPAERMEALHAAEEILMDEMGLGPIYFYTNRHMLNPDVKGVYYTPLGYYFFHYATK